MTENMKFPNLDQDREHVLSLLQEMEQEVQIYAEALELPAPAVYDVLAVIHGQVWSEKQPTSGDLFSKTVAYENANVEALMVKEQSEEGYSVHKKQEEEISRISKDYTSVLVEQDRVRAFSAFQRDGQVSELLSQLDPYIKHLAQQYIPRASFSENVWEDEIEELVQVTRIKFWKRTMKEGDFFPIPFLRTVVRNQARDLMRRYIQNQKRFAPYEEIEKSNIQTSFGSVERGDPINEYEEKESVLSLLNQTMGLVVTFPPSQRRAILCTLKERFEEDALLYYMFLKWDINGDEISWPQDKREIRRLKALLPTARQKLAFLYEQGVS